LPGFFGWSGFFAMAAIWGWSDDEKRANAHNSPVRHRRCAVMPIIS
jgi:hypothetical protein